MPPKAAAAAAPAAPAASKATKSGKKGKYYSAPTLLCRGLWSQGRTIIRKRAQRHTKYFLAAKKARAEVKPKSEQKAPTPKKEVGYYPVDRKRRPIHHRFSHAAPKLRSSITPGTVVIILAGRFKGRRVVVLKYLPTSGTVVVSGPLKLNGVPLRRVNPAYLIATSTKVDVSKIDVSKVDDALFRAPTVKKDKKKKAGAEAFFAEKEQAPVQLSEAYKEQQKAADAALTKAIEAVPMMSKYLQTRFALSNSMIPHLLKF